MALFRETFGGERIRVEPSPHEPLQIDATLTRAQGLGLLSGRRSALRSDFADGHDRLIFSLGSEAVGRQFGRDIVLEQGDAIAFSGADVGSLITLRGGPIATLDFPQGALVPMLKDPRMACGRRIPRGSPALQLLRGYLNALHTSKGLSVSALQPLAIAHIYDLAALAVGAGRQAEEVAGGRGMRAARLQAIKADILGSLERQVSLSEVAAGHRLSPRYIRMLFEGEGLTFTEFVREQRLLRARSKLLSARCDHLRISDIAYESGFNDLSYFNRAFRRRFGHSPGEARERRRSGF
jgi:AraC-like DNA-binding protein